MALRFVGLLKRRRIRRHSNLLMANVERNVVDVVAIIPRNPLGSRQFASSVGIRVNLENVRNVRSFQTYGGQELFTRFEPLL